MLMVGPTHVVGLLFALLFLASSSRADEAQLVDQFLSRLGLTELRLLHSEHTLERENASDKRLALARELADGYAEALIAAADDDREFARLKGHIEKLLAIYPAARTPGADVVLLQA